MEDGFIAAGEYLYWLHNIPRFRIGNPPIAASWLDFAAIPGYKCNECNVYILSQDIPKYERHELKCPHCNEVNMYSRKELDVEGSLQCHSCGKKFWDFEIAPKSFKRSNDG